MPEKKTIERARKRRARGGSASSEAGEFVREEMHHIRRGEHGARSAKQAIAIGLSKARRAGVDLPPPRKGKAPAATRKRAARDYAEGQAGVKSKPSATRSRAITRALRREGSSAASHRALSAQARRAASKRTASERSASARKAARSRTPAQRSASARKAARTRARH